MLNQSPLSSAPRRQYNFPTPADLDFNFPAHLLPPEEPSEVLASWNAANAFSGDNWREALDLVLQQRAGATYIAEFMKLGPSPGDRSFFRTRTLEIQGALAGTGYGLHLQDMSADNQARNVHWQAVIARHDPNIVVSQAVFGERRGFVVDLGRVATRATLLHAPDDSAEKRLKTARTVHSGYDRTNGAAVGYKQYLATPGHEHDGIVVGGDLNAIAADDRNARLARLMNAGLRAANRVATLFNRQIGVSDYYNDSKPLQRAAGKVLRIAGMTDESLSQLEGLRDADSWHEPTIEQAIVKGAVLKVLKLAGMQGLTAQRYHIDHFMTSADANVVPGSYQVREPRISGGPLLSDHSLIRLALHRANPRRVEPAGIAQQPAAPAQTARS